MQISITLLMDVPNHCGLFGDSDQYLFVCRYIQFVHWASGFGVEWNRVSIRYVKSDKVANEWRSKGEGGLVDLIWNNSNPLGLVNYWIGDYLYWTESDWITIMLRTESIFGCTQGH